MSSGRHRALSAVPTYCGERLTSLSKRRRQTYDHPTPLPSLVQLHQDLDRARQLSRRNFTPRFLRFLEEWKDKLVDATQRWESSHREEERKEVDLSSWRAMIESRVEKVESRELLANEAVAELVDLRRLKFLLDYADYLKIDLDPLRTDSKHRQAEWNRGDTNWRRVVEILRSTDSTREATRRKLESELKEVADNELGCPYDHLIFQIETYALRNQLAHSDLRYFIHQHEWTKLGAKILHDRAELPNWVPPSRPHELKAWEETLDRVQQRYFKHLDRKVCDRSDYAIALDEEQKRKQHARERSKEGEEKAQERRQKTKEGQMGQPSVAESERDKRLRSEPGSRQVSGNLRPRKFARQLRVANRQPSTSSLTLTATAANGTETEMVLRQTESVGETIRISTNSITTSADAGTGKETGAVDTDAVGHRLATGASQGYEKRDDEEAHRNYAGFWS